MANTESKRSGGLLNVGAGRRAMIFALLSVLASALVFVGCLSPTLPLPPPSRPVVTAPDDDGMIRVTGVVRSRALVFVHNTRSNEIVGEATGDSGRYDVVLAAEIGDVLVIWQSYDTRESETIEVTVPAVDSVGPMPPPPEAVGGASQ